MSAGVEVMGGSSLASSQGTGTECVVPSGPFSPRRQPRGETGHHVKWRSRATALYPHVLTPCQEVCRGLTASGMEDPAAQRLSTLPAETQLSGDCGSSTGGCAVPVLGRDTQSLLPGGPVSWVVSELQGKGDVCKVPGQDDVFL